MLKMPASGVLDGREAYLVRRNEPAAYDSWRESELELPKPRIDSSSRQTALFLIHQPSAIRHTLFYPANGYDTSFNSGEAWIQPTLIGLSTDNNPMTPQALSHLTRSIQVASTSPTGPRFHQPLEAQTYLSLG